MNELGPLVAELKAIRDSMLFSLIGNESEIMGKKRYACKMCGHCPDALIERLEAIIRHETKYPSKPKAELKAKP